MGGAGGEFLPPLEAPQGAGNQLTAAEMSFRESHDPVAAVSHRSRPSGPRSSDDRLPSDELRRAQHRTHGRPALAVRLLESLRLRPGPERVLVTPDRMRGVESRTVLLRSLEEVERLEARHVVQVGLAIAPGVLEFLATIGRHSE